MGDQPGHVLDAVVLGADRTLAHPALQMGDVRGLGAMVAFELVEDRQSKTAAPELTNCVVAECEKRGLIVLPCGTRANVVRILPPLTIEDELLDEALDILEASIEAAFSEPAR